MIIDTLNNYLTYIAINKDFKKAFAFINDNLSNFPATGDYEIENRNIYSLVRVIETRPAEKCNWEAHKEYIDIHYIFDGEELIGYTNIEKMCINEYLRDKDKLILSGDGDMIKITKGSFAIFFHQDAHMPGIKSCGCKEVKKIIIKVKTQYTGV